MKNVVQKILFFVLVCIQVQVFSKEHLTQWTNQETKYYPMDMVDLTGYMGSPESGGMLDFRLPLWALPRTLFFGDVRLRSGSETKEFDAGLAIRRSLFENSPWNFVGGVYGFYRRMRSSNQNYYTAINPGFELLSDGPELRANGYFSNPKSYKFDEEQFIEVDGLGTTTTTNFTREWAPSGFDVEGGWKFRVQRKWDVGLYGGYFRYHRNDSGTATGPIARILVTRQDFLVPGGRFEIGGRVQPIGGQRPIIYGYARISMPIYSRKPTRPLNNLDYLMAQPIYNELAIFTKEKRFSHTLASLEGSIPIIFITANGTGDGSQSNPASLVTTDGLMENESVLFLLNDDGNIDVTVLDDDQIDLLENVQLLGIGNGTTRNVTVGSQTFTVTSNTGRPTLTSTNSGVSVIQLASGNTVSGFDVDGGNNAILGVGGTGATITDMNFSNQSSAGILLTLFDGIGVTLQDISVNTAGFAGIDLFSPTGTYTISNITVVDAASEGIGVFQTGANPGTATINIAGTNTISTTNTGVGTGIIISNFDGTLNGGDWTMNNLSAGISTANAIGTVNFGNVTLNNNQGIGLNFGHASGSYNQTGIFSSSSGTVGIQAGMSTGTASAVINSISLSNVTDFGIDSISNAGTLTINGGSCSMSAGICASFVGGSGTANLNNTTFTATSSANGLLLQAGNGENINFTGCTVTSVDDTALIFGNNANGAGTFTNCTFETTGSGGSFFATASGVYNFINSTVTYSGTSNLVMNINNYNDLTIAFDSDSAFNINVTDANAGGFFVGGASTGNGNFNFNDVTVTSTVANNNTAFQIQNTQATDSFTFRNVNIDNFNQGMNLSGVAPINMTSATITNVANQGVFIGSSDINATFGTLNVTGGSGALDVSLFLTSNGSLTVSGGTLSNSGSDAILIDIFGSGTLTCNFSNMTIINPTGSGIVLLSEEENAILNATVNNNTISGAGFDAFYVYNASFPLQNNLNIDVNNNNFTSPGNVTYLFESDGATIGLVGTLGVGSSFNNDNGNLANNGNQSDGGAPSTQFFLIGNNITIISALP